MPEEQKPKHTPGPFHVESGQVWAEAPDGTNLKLASIHAVLHHVSIAERNANANLFAAAPQLLEALKDFLSIDASHDSMHDMVQRYERARAVVAKAEGRNA